MFPVAGCRRLHMNKYKSGLINPVAGLINVDHFPTNLAIQVSPRPPGGHAGRPRGGEWRGGCAIPAGNRPWEKESMWQDYGAPFTASWNVYLGLYDLKNLYYKMCIHMCTCICVCVCIYVMWPSSVGMYWDQRHKRLEYSCSCTFSFDSVKP